MFQLTYLALGAFATGGMLLAMRSNVDWLTRFLSALFSTISWGVFALESLNVEVVSNGTVVAQSYSTMAALGAASGAVMLLVTLQYAFQALGSTDGSDSMEMMQ